MIPAPGPSPTDAAGVVAAARRIEVQISPTQAERVLAYLDAMLAINEHINLTAVRDREQAVVLHVLDSLALAKTELAPLRALDIGTGNGFPGVAIATLYPGADVMLIDRTGKKVRAVGSCLVTAGLDTVEVVQLDAAQAPTLQRELRHAFDLVTARAVGKPAELAQLAEPLTRPGGHLVLWLDAEADAPERLRGFRRVRLIDYELPQPAARRRRLGVWRRGR